MTNSIIDSAQAVLQPIIVDNLEIIIGGLLTWFFGLLPFSRQAKASYEAKLREGLHSALNTGVGLTIDMIQQHPSVAAYDHGIGEIVAYVERSVPDALRKLGPSRAQLEDMARSKLQQKLDELLQRDRLAEALARAGVTAPEPTADGATGTPAS